MADLAVKFPDVSSGLRPFLDPRRMSRSHG